MKKKKYTHAEKVHLLVKYDLDHGTSLEKMGEILKERELKEDYEGCSGIKKAIDEKILNPPLP